MAERYQGFGAVSIYTSDDPALSSLADDVVAQALMHISQACQAKVILLGATRRGRALAPYLAQLLQAGCVTEALEIDVEDGQLITGRYALGGNTISRERLTTTLQVIAVTPGTVSPAERADGTAQVVPIDLALTASRAAVIERQEKPPVDVDITISEKLVVVGRGVASKDDLALAEELASSLGAEVACTRPLSSELEWLPEERMIGISGRKSSAKLLVSIGISGQVQHAVGITGARTIVAVNSDANAPIFKLADYGLVGDLYAVLPALTSALKARHGA